MKIGNIQELIRKITGKYKEMKEESVSGNLEHEIKRLPKNCLDDYFQKRFNKNLDYDQWAGIRDELDGMGRTLFERTLEILGDTLFVIQARNEAKIQDLEYDVKRLNEENDKLKVELKKYVD